MQAVSQGYRGLALMVWLNSDRLIAVAALLAGLMAGAYVGTLSLGP